VRGLQLSRDHAKVAFYASDGSVPDDLFAGSVAERPARLTSTLNPAITREDLVVPTRVRFTSYDGIEIRACCTRRTRPPPPATRAGAQDATGREALLRYVLRPPLAQERLEQRPNGLVRITLKKAYADGTIAVDMDPLSLMCRLATSVPPPRRHTIKYSGVLAPASPWRRHLTPMAASPASSPRWTRRPRRPAARSPRGPPYWKSRVLRLKALGEEDAQGRWVQETA
jgi:hypothetical protein